MSVVAENALRMADMRNRGVWMLSIVDNELVVVKCALSGMRYCRSLLTPGTWASCRPPTRVPNLWDTVICE